MTSLGPWRDPWFGSPFSSDIWDPSPRELRRGRDDDVSAVAHASVDWRETDNAHIIRADLPGLFAFLSRNNRDAKLVSKKFLFEHFVKHLAGVRREDVKVQVEDGNVLQISGEKSKEKKETGDRWHRVERERGSFLRRFRLPENANTEAISCGLENGVLTVNVPKKEAGTRSDVRMIDIA